MKKHSSHLTNLIIDKILFSQSNCCILLECDCSCFKTCADMYDTMDVGRGLVMHLCQIWPCFKAGIKHTYKAW